LRSLLGGECYLPQFAIYLIGLALHLCFFFRGSFPFPLSLKSYRVMDGPFACGLSGKSFCPRYVSPGGSFFPSLSLRVSFPRPWGGPGEVFFPGWILSPLRSSADVAFLVTPIVWSPFYMGVAGLRLLRPFFFPRPALSCPSHPLYLVPPIGPVQLFFCPPPPTLSRLFLAHTFFL